MSDIYLRAMNIEDIYLTHKWHNDEDLYKTLVGPFRFVSTDAEKEWIKNKTTFSNQEINLMICLTETTDPIGLISVRDINWPSRIGHLTGIFIGEKKFRGHGFGTKALNLLIEHCFDDLGLNRIWAYILSENQASISMFKKCGFIVEGKLRQHAFKNGRFVDVIFVGLCADQYFEKSN